MKTVPEIEELSEQEFEEAYASGVFRGEINAEDPVERYMEYQGKWYPAHSNQKDVYIEYKIKDSRETILEETPSLMTFDEYGYNTGTLSKHLVLGNYGQSYLASEPDWDHEGGEYFLWELKENQKHSFLRLKMAIHLRGRLAVCFWGFMMDPRFCVVSMWTRRRRTYWSMT